MSSPRVRLFLVFLLALVALSGAVLAESGLDTPGLAAVPVPPWALNCNLNPPYYSYNEVNVWHSSGATSYQVFRGASSGGSYSYVGNATDVSTWVNIFYDYDVDTFEVYYYKAKACNSSGCSALSTAYAACQLDTYDPPTGVSASDGTYSGYVRVTYNDCSGPSQYGICRSATSGGSYSRVGWDWDGTYDDTSATPGVKFYYKVNSCTGAEKCGTESGYNSGHRKMAGPSYILASNGN